MKTLIKIALLMAAFAVPMFAVDEIYTWGYGRQMHDVLRAASMLTGNSNDYLLKIAVGIGCIVLIMRTAAVGKVSAMDFAKFFAMTIFIIQFFWVQKSEFIVRDQTNNFVSPVVLSLPQGVGTTFSMFSKLENGLGQAFEANFSTPNSISYQKAGLGFMMSAHLGMDSLTAQDPSLIRTFNEYLDNCLLNSAAMGNLDISTLQNSKDLINALAINEAWLTPVYSGTTAASMMQCSEAWDNIKGRLPADADNAVSVFAKSFGQLSAADVKSKLGDVAQTMFSNAAVSSSAYINQMSLMNMYSQGMQAVAMSTASDLSAVATASAIAQSSTKAGWIQAGLQAKRTLPMQKAFLTIVSVVMLLLMSLYSVAIADFSGIKQMFQLLFVYILWTPLAIVINFMTYSTIESVTSGLTGSDLPTLLSKASIANETQSYLAFLGYSVSLVTAMAFMLVTKNGLTFVNQVASAGMSASSLKAAETAGGLGNFSHGNINNQNTSVGNENRFGRSYYGMDVAAQGDGFAYKFEDGVSNYSSSHPGTNIQTRGGGVVDATFAGDKTSSVKIDGVGAENILESSSRGAAEKQASTKSAMESISIQTADNISTAFKTAKTRQEQQKVANTYGLSYEQAQTISNIVEEARAEATKTSITNKQSDGNTKSVDGKTYVKVEASAGFNVGGTGASIAAGAEGSKTTSSKHEETTETQKSAEAQKAYKEAFNKNIQNAMKTNQSFSQAIEQSLTSSATAENAKTHSDVYQTAKQYQELKQLSNELSNQQSISGGLSKNINAIVLDRMAEKHGHHKADEKADYFEKLRTAIVVNGDKDAYNEFRNETLAVMAEHGIKTDVMQKVEAKLKNIETDINASQTNIANKGSQISGETKSASNSGFAPLDTSAPKEIAGQFANDTQNANKTFNAMGAEREADKHVVQSASDNLKSNVTENLESRLGPVKGMANASGETFGDMFRNPIKKEDRAEYIRQVANSGIKSNKHSKSDEK